MDPNLEMMVIYSMIQRPPFIPQVLEIVSEKDFHNTTCRHSFLTLKRMKEEGRDIDIATVWTELGKPDGMVTKLLEQDEFTIFDPTHYAMLLRKEILEERIKESARNREYYELKADLSEMENLQKPASLYTISKMIEDGSMSKERFETGYCDLDRIVAIRPSNLVVLAGRTSIGKSTMGLTMLSNMATRIPVGMISFEMVYQGISERLMKMFSLDYLDRINSSLFVSSPPVFNLMHTRRAISDMKSRKGVKVVMVDYLQLMQEGSQFRSRHLEISYIIRKLAEMAKEFQIAMVVVAQISRGIDSRGERARPVLGDLKESGDIENAADIVFFIHRYKAEKEAELLIAKNRYGGKGIISLVWNEARTKYETVTRIPGEDE